MEYFADIERYILLGEYPAGLSKGDKANLRRRCRNNFKLEAGILYYRRAGGGDAEPWRIVVRTEKEKQRILESCHVAVGGEHLGRDKTIREIETQFYWKNSADIRTSSETTRSIGRSVLGYNRSFNNNPSCIPFSQWSQKCGINETTRSIGRSVLGYNRSSNNRGSKPCNLGKSVLGYNESSNSRGSNPCESGKSTNSK